MRNAFIALCALLLWSMPATAQQNPPQLQFDSVADFFKLPEGVNFGEVSGVAVNSKGSVFVFTRSNSASGPAYGPAAAQLLEFDATGKFVREIGKGLYGWSFAHTVRVDRNDNIWAVDKGSDMVIRFNPQGRVVWVFGRRVESADDEAKPWEHVNPPLPPVNGRFRQPTDVAWDSEGNIYITDGYVNSRVAKYSKDGDWVKSWGEPGTGPGQFNTPHAIAIDRNNNVYVGDRGNRRVQVFDTDGKFLRMFTVDVPIPPGTVPGQRQHADRREFRHRRAQLAVHPAWQRPGDVPRREHVPWSSVQDHARGQGARRDRPLRPQPEAVLRRAPAGLPVGDGSVRRRNVQLARAEADPARSGPDDVERSALTNGSPRTWGGPLRPAPHHPEVARLSESSTVAAAGL